MCELESTVAQQEKWKETQESKKETNQLESKRPNNLNQVTDFERTNSEEVANLNARIQYQERINVNNLLNQTKTQKNFIFQLQSNRQTNVPSRSQKSFEK